MGRSEATRGKSPVGTAVSVLAQMLVGALTAVIIATVGLTAIATVEWPAFPSSNQLHALTTVGQVTCLLGLVTSAWVWRRGWATAARVGAAVFLSSFAVVTLGMPLGATKLYLFGISVDQQFRTEYVTRFADSPALRDMTYAGIPPFYPPGWFWLGGRAAALTGTPGWEMFKPWAITSIAVAVVVAFALWAALIRFETALAVAAATAAVTLAYSSPEPYAAIVTVMIPPVLVLAWSGLRSRGRAGRAAVGGVGVFLGVTAMLYTLLFVYTAFAVAIMGVAAAAAGRRIGPLLRVMAIALVAAVLASVTWLPFLLRAARGPVADGGAAQHYLPDDGAVLAFPMLQISLLGALCMCGAIWLAWRSRSSVRAAALGIGVLALYAWSLLSMLTTLAGTTLLSFRLQPTLIVLLAAAGTFGFIEVARGAAGRWSPRILPAAAGVGLIGAIGFSQDIPEVLRPDITVAYTDTDGDGQRGDRRPPGAEKFYPRIDAAIREATGLRRDETVVLTADYSFLSYYPYFGFQGLTSHYANPLAEFGQRSAAIESWSNLEDPEAFVRALDNLPWESPDVFLLRRGGAAGSADTYTLRLAEDVYPNQPNVRRYTVEFDAGLFAKHFTVQDIGPFVLAVRRAS